MLIDPTGIYEKGNVAWIEKVIIKEKDEDQKEYLRRWAKEDRISNPLKHKDRELRRMFGITLKDYQEMLDNQNGRCTICGELEEDYNQNGHKFSMAVDHCHKTGKVRSLLCGRCNKSLGGFKDSQELLIKAIEYLKQYQPTT
jgi:hypothetical protein